MSRKKRSVTRWNILALCVAILGAVTTIGVSQAYLHQWTGSGVKFSPMHPNEVMLPAGRSLVFYESKVGVPATSDRLYLFRPDGEKYFPGQPRDRQSYRSYFSGISGRAMWELDLPVAGLYRFQPYNSNVLSVGDIPIDDRIVFLKSPGTLAEVRTVQTAIQVTGASLTLALVAFLYLIHLRTLKQLNGLEEDLGDSPEEEWLEDELFINPAES